MMTRLTMTLLVLISAVRYIAAPIARAAFVVASILYAASPSFAASDGSVVIHVDYSVTLNRLHPEPKNGIITHISLTAVLSGTNKVEEKWERRSLRYRDQNASARVLGGSEREVGGEWHVVSPKELVRRIEFPHNSTIITITLIGEKSCQATIDFVLKPGYREFTFRRLKDGQIAYFNQVRVISSTCRIE